jgi:hypothetical protein
VKIGIVKREKNSKEKYLEFWIDGNGFSELLTGTFKTLLSLQ